MQPISFGSALTAYAYVLAHGEPPVSLEALAAFGVIALDSL